MPSIYFDLDIAIWRWRILSVVQQGLAYGAPEYRLDRVAGGWHGGMSNEQSEELALAAIDDQVVLAGWCKDIETTSKAEDLLRERMYKTLARTHRRLMPIVRGPRFLTGPWTYCLWGTLSKLEAVCAGSARTGAAAYKQIGAAALRLNLLQCPTADLLRWANEYHEWKPRQLALAAKVIHGLPVAAKDVKGALTAERLAEMRSRAADLGLDLRLE